MDDESINAKDLPPGGMTEEQFSIFVNTNNDLDESDEISDSQLHQSETDENEPDEECNVKNISSHIESNNACEVIRHSLKMKLMKNALSKISHCILKLIMLVKL